MTYRIQWKEVGRRLRQLRDNERWTLDYVAGLAEISAGYLSRLERGLRDSPSLDLLLTLASVYRVSLDSLLRERDIPRIYLDPHDPTRLTLFAGGDDLTPDIVRAKREGDAGVTFRYQGVPRFLGSHTIYLLDSSNATNTFRAVVADRLGENQELRPERGTDDHHVLWFEDHYDSPELTVVDLRTHAL